MIKRLRKRFIRIAMLSVTVVMVLLAVLVNAVNFASTDSDLTKTLDMICENQGTIPEHALLGGGRKGFPESGGAMPGKKMEKSQGPFNQETPYATRYFCLFYDGDGILNRADLDHIAAITGEDTGGYLETALKHGTGYGYTSGYKYCVIKQGEDRYMAVFLDCYQELRSVRVVAASSLLAVIICVILVYILVVFFSGKAIDPVVQSAERQKQFITDAGHELKTPITVIATCLKVLEMETGKQKWIDKAAAQTEKLKDLVNSLVMLSRMDEEELPLKPELFAVSDAVAETAESFVDFARSRGHELELEIAPDIRYCGDEYAIRQLVSVLLDNAIKYASENTPIRISLEKTRKGIIIRTVNTCEKLDPEGLDRLFDRFYRADPSRSEGTGGFGIGLSIARSIAEGHKGSVKAKCIGENEIEFTAELK